MEGNTSALPLAKAMSVRNWTSPHQPQNHTILLSQPQITRDTTGRASLCEKACCVEQQKEQVLHVGIWGPGEKWGENGTGLYASSSFSDNQETPEDRGRPHERPAVYPRRSIPTDQNLVLGELGLGRAPGQAAGGFTPHFWEKENLRTRVDRRSRIKTIGERVDKKAQKDRPSKMSQTFRRCRRLLIYCPLSAEPGTHAFPACSPSKPSELSPSLHPFPHQVSRPAFLF